MSKRADGDERTEAICTHCFQRIVARTFLGGYWWTHQPAGAAFADGQHDACYLSTATPDDTMKVP